MNSLIIVVMYDKECTKLNIEKGLKEISNLTSILHLKLGPSLNNIRIDREELVKHLSPLCPGLLTLQLIGVKALTDEAMADILDHVSDSLTSLSIIDIEFGTLAVEVVNYYNIFKHVIYSL